MKNTGGKRRGNAHHSTVCLNPHSNFFLYYIFVLPPVFIDVLTLPPVFNSALMFPLVFIDTLKGTAQKLWFLDLHEPLSRIPIFFLQIYFQK